MRLGTFIDNPIFRKVAKVKENFHFYVRFRSM